MHHTKPCSECPFRKKSLPGYVGGHASIIEIIDFPVNDRKFPCHQQVNAIRDYLIDEMYDPDDPFALSNDEAFRQASREAPHCAGSLAFMNNLCKKSRDRQTADLQDIVGKRNDVFSSPDMMRQHHDPDGEPYVFPVLRC